MTRKPWGVEFTAHPEEVAVLRRAVRLRLVAWGLHELVDTAQLCVSELVSNIVTHVGIGTPGSLGISMNGTHLRIEVRDPDTRALPTLVAAEVDAEGGRGMALVDALADRWGVRLHEDHKVTWCELVAVLAVPEGYVGGARGAKAARALSSYGESEPCTTIRRSRLGSMAAGATAIDVIADLLHWLWAHGHDADDILDRAQTRFEAELEAKRTP
ncbi:ATP-binding protein [Streptomyces viridosporus]|uniref:ATP-binding protein n=1 Tax=Streptomyces viridosporus TaxID=67581 RepID=UPI0033344249